MTLRSQISHALVAAGATLLAGCASPTQQLATPPAEPSIAAPAVTLPTTAVAPAPAGPESERFSLDVADAPARAFFAGLVDGTRENILIHPDVSGSITLRLKEVTVSEVLEAVSQLYGYDYRRTRAGYLVLPATVQTRLFKLDYLDLMRSGSSRTRVSSGQVSQGSSAQYGGGAVGGDSAAPGDKEESATEITGTSIHTRYRNDFWAELEENLRVIVGDKEGQSVVIHAQAGVIAVRAAPAELRAVDDYLQRIQDTVARQVVLEARIIEIELNDAFQAGINWALVIQNGTRTYTAGQIAPRTFDGDLLGAGIVDNVDIAPGNPVTGFTNQTLGGAFTLALDFTDFNAFIELLKTQGDARVLSSPRVSTLHNQKAVIKAGSDEFFVTDISSNTVTGTSSATNRDVELTPFFSGIALDVTPQIAADGAVILHVHPTVSDVTDQVKALTVAGVTDQIPLAFSEIRESDSVVRARSGQVIVIGGLMRDTRRRQDFRTPVLGDIPVLGRLFRSTREVTRKTELVILLRPIVIENDAQWAGLTVEPQSLRGR